MKKFYQKFKVYFLIVALICFSLGLSTRTFASTTFNNTNTMQLVTSASGSGSINDTTNMSVTAGGTNTVAFACIAYDGNATDAVVSPTWNGVAMTQVGPKVINTAAGLDSVEIWYIKNPATGTHPLAFTFSGTAPSDVYYNLVSFNNVNQTNPVRPGSYTNVKPPSTVPGNPGRITVPSNLNDLTMTCTNTGGQSIAVNSSNQTEDGFNSGGGEGGASDHATASATSVTHVWTYGGTTNYVIAGFSINGDPNTTITVATSTQGTLSVSGGTLKVMGGTLSK